jgi:hypothetical protein
MSPPHAVPRSQATVLSGRKMGPQTASVARKGIAKAVSKCGEYATLVWLMESLPFSGPKAESQVLAALLKAIAKLLGAKGALRLDFMQRGALTLVQDAKNSSAAELREALKTLNAAYPKQMVEATDPNYEASLLAQIT